MRNLWKVAILAVAFSTPVCAAETITYTYDALGRLVSVVHTGTVNNNQQTVYSIDLADNRTSVAVTGASH